MKWQDVLKILGSSAGVLVVIAGLFNLVGMSYTTPPDIVCVDCYSRVDINSTYWEIKVEHAGMSNPIMFKKTVRGRTLWVNLDRVDSFVPTAPYVEVDVLVPTIKKYATIKHPELGYLRPIKDGDTLIARKTASNPSGDWFVLHTDLSGVKQTVKYGLELEHWQSEDISFDPLWIYESGGSDPSLIAYWKLDGNASDSSGNGNDGTVTGANVTPYGKFNSAYSFDGVDDCINFGDINDDSANSTITFWFYTNPSLATDGYLFDNRAGTPTGKGYIYYTQASSTLYKETGTLKVNGVVSSTFTKGAWNFITLNGTDLTGGNGFRLGCRYSDTIFSTGIIDEVRIYNRSLSSAEILELYNQTMESHSIKLMGIGSASEVADDNLISHIPFDGSVSDTKSVVSCSALGNVKASPFGKFNGAYYLAGGGGTDYLSCGTPTGINKQNFTMSYWLKPKLDGNYHGIVYRGTTSAFMNRIESTNKMFFGIVNSTGSTKSVYSDLALVDDSWQHIVSIHNSTHAYMFVNGVKQADIKSCVGVYYIGTEAMSIGGYSIYMYKGWLDDFRFYDVALSDSEILELYNQTMESHSIKLMGSGSASEVASANLEGYWKLDGNGVDSSGNGYTGSVTGAKVTPFGRFNSAYDFVNGNVIDMGDNDALIGVNYTYSMWVKPSSVAGTGGLIFKWQTNNGIIVYANGQTIQQYDNQGASCQVTGNILNTGVWSHLVVVYMWNGTGIIYHNGVNVAQDSDCGDITDNNYPFYLGRYSGGTDSFDGVIDEFRVYDKILSSAEVLELYNQTMESHSIKLMGNPSSIGD